MFKITSLAFALLVNSSFSDAASARQLSEEKFVTYEPLTKVTDHAAIDLDQAALEEQLALGTDQGRQHALAVYTQGAHSKSYAEVKLSAALATNVQKGTEVVGKDGSGNEVRGSVYADAAAGTDTLKIQYATISVQDSYVACQVGASPDPKVDGCFSASGSLTVGALGSLAYSYDQLTGNKNGRTLQGFSTEARAKMYDCATCPYATYAKFYDYYGEYDYADKWVMAAFNKASTSFTNGDADFSKYGNEGTTEAIKKGTSYMNVWMYVVREMEDQIDDCLASCPTDGCNDDQVAAWDEAVAFYVGSQAKGDITGANGYLPYTLAQKRCANFGTCLTSGSETGMAAANSEIFRNFQEGKQLVQQGQCEAARKNVARITEMMTAPLVQGTLRYAYITDKQNDKREKPLAEGAVFAAAVLPIVASCSSSDAKTIYDNMKVGGSAKFEDVKAAFEANYACMGLTCGDVGGLVDEANGGYLAGAEPCGGSSSSLASGAAPRNLVFGSVVAAVIASLVV